MKRRCLKCGAEWEIKGPVTFREECPECAAFVHTCVYCGHFDSRNRICPLPNTEAVRDWSEMNFCEEFEYGPGAGPGSGKGGPPAGPAAGRTAPKQAEGPISAEEARRRFEGLFRDGKT
jgi:hypothetical protein